MCLALPAAVIALLFLWIGTRRRRWAIALVVFPHVYRYSKNQLVATYQSPHVLAAEAKGLSSWRVLLAHVFTPAAPQLAALAGISVSLAFGASIPIEVIWTRRESGNWLGSAAMDRDLPLLVNITVLVALMTLVANSLADLALAAWRPEPLGRRHEGRIRIAAAGSPARSRWGCWRWWRWRRSRRDFIAHSSYSEQFRDAISAPPSSRFLLGTDELGRDRFARLLYGTRVSLLLAPAAALLSTLLAALIGGAGRIPGRTLGALDHFRSRSVSLAAVAVPAAGGARACCRSIPRPSHR